MNFVFKVFVNQDAKKPDLSTLGQSPPIRLVLLG